jgi:hypothetical protein
MEQQYIEQVIVNFEGEGIRRLPQKGATSHDNQWRPHAFFPFSLATYTDDWPDFLHPSTFLVERSAVMES